jgi:small subunit ribosomal protein S3
MGQKINPIGLRLGINKTWDSRWFAGDDYAAKLHEDIKIRRHVKKALNQAGVAKVIIERTGKKCYVSIHSARPGIIIGKKGADIDKVKKEVQKFTKDEVHVNIIEVRKPELDSTLVAESIAQQLERRVAFRRAMKRAVQSSMRMGAEGIRINVSGRLGGAEISRMEWYREGRVPLHTLRADVDYGIASALTTYGIIGVKVWIFKGEILKDQELQRIINTRNRTTHKNEVTWLIDLDDLEVLDGNALHPKVAGHFLVLEGTAWILTLTGRTMRTVRHRNPVRCFKAAEVPTFHRTSEALTFRDTDHIDILAGNEVVGANFVPYRQQRIFRHAELNELLLGFDVSFREHGFLRLVNAVRFGFARTDLNGRIAILCGRALCSNLHVIKLQHGDWHATTEFVVNAGHPDFVCKYSSTRHGQLPTRRSKR